MYLFEILTVLAIFLGPLLAIQTQGLLSARRESRERRLQIFKTLMSTRANTVSHEHVQALNMIDIEFRGRKYGEVRESWKIYRNHLNDPSMHERFVESEGNRIAVENWLKTGSSYLIDLLKKMGRSLGYEFDQVDLEKNIYAPLAHSSIGQENDEIRRRLLYLLRGEKSLPMEIVKFPENEPPSGIPLRRQ